MKVSINSLPVQLSVYISSILLVIFLLGMSLVGYFGFRGFYTTLNRHGITTAEETAYRLDQVFVQAELATSILANMLEHYSPKKENFAHLLDVEAHSIHQRCPELAVLTITFDEDMLVPGEKYNSFSGFFDQDGYHYIQSDTPNLDYFDMDWFLVPVAMEKPVWTIPYHSRYLNDAPLLLGYSRPFYRTDKNGKRKVAGVIMFDINITLLGKYLPNLSLAGEDHAGDGKSFLMNQFGQFILFPSNEANLAKTIFTLCDESDNPDGADREMARSIFHNENNSGKVSFHGIPFMNEPTDVFYARCVNHWVVGIVVQADWIYEVVYPFFIKFVLGCFLCILLNTFFIFVVTRRLNRPLVALSQAAEEIGQGHFDIVLPQIKDNNEIKILGTSFEKMQAELADYIERLKQTISARERAEGELNVARTIQQDILPRFLPPFPNCPNVSGAAMLKAARGVGGDLYDLFFVDEERLAIIIGDVSGKGVPAALFMAVTQTLQRSLAQSIKSVDQLVINLNSLLVQQNNSGMFVTYWIGFLNIKTGSLSFSNAGHNPPIIRKPDGSTVTLKQLHGFPLAISDKCDNKSDEIQLSDGDMLILYTDGVTEAFNEKNEQYSFERLKNVVENTQAIQPQEMIDEIYSDVIRHANGFGQSDDITILAIRFNTL